MRRDRSVAAVIFMLTLIPPVVVYYYRVGDWMGGPLMILYLLIPLSIVQLVVTLLRFGKKEDTKALMSLQTAIMLFSNGLMVYYIKIH
jgi:hypothetical protein